MYGCGAVPVPGMVEFAKDVGDADRVEVVVVTGDTGIELELDRDGAE